MFFDRIEHTTCLLDKIKFFIVYDKILFLVHFLVVNDYELPKGTSHIIQHNFKTFKDYEKFA